MTKQDFKEMLYLAKMEMAQEIAANKKKQLERLHFLTSARTYKISIVWSDSHPVYGRSRETKYSSFEMDGYENAFNVFLEYKESARSMKIEKIRIYMLDADGTKNLIKGINFI